MHLFGEGRHGVVILAKTGKGKQVNGDDYRLSGSTLNGEYRPARIFRA
jgi:hypothetical protein